MRRSILLLIWLYIFLTGIFNAGFADKKSQNAPGKKPVFNFKLKDEIPIDSEIKLGKFKNGLSYYIRVNHKPEKRAELRLVINAGSVLEDDDQQGIAHLVEHMAFNGTKNFAKQELVNYLESIGMRFGPDLNAYTSFDETVYMLQIPTDSVVIVEKAFQILEDWARFMSLEDQEIDKERGVIVEEWRLGRGAEMRMMDKQFPILFQGSKYANRLPIGQKTVIDTVHFDTVRRFYREWYRPDLMAVIAVGDFDQAWIEKLIQQHFGKIPAVKKARKRAIIPVPDHKEPLFAIATDPEATRTSVGIYFKQPPETEKTVADYRKNVVEQLYNRMLSERLYELSKDAEPPFLYGYSQKGGFVRSKEVYMLGAGVKEDGIIRGLEVLLTEAERVQKHGFTSTELERQKKMLLRSLKQTYSERNKLESRNYASEYIRHFLDREPIPGIEYEYALMQKYLPEIQLVEVNQLASKWITDHNRVVTVSAPEKAEVKVPDTKELMAVFAAVAQKRVEPYVDKVTEQPLVEKAPKPADLISDRSLEELGVTEWLLANGVRVIFKPTDFKNDEIRFTAYSPGGSSLVPDKNYISAATATAIITEGGLGKYNQIELGKALAGKVVRVNPWIGELEEGISGSASPEDLETMFQLIYAYFTTPRKDSTAFQSYKNRLSASIENRSARPESAFQDSITVTLYQRHFRERPWSKAILNEMSLDGSYRIYQDRFADASDFTFVFVGNFDLDIIKPLVQTYLGGLPVLNRNESWKDVGRRYPVGVFDKSVHKGIEPKSYVQIIFTGPFYWNPQNAYMLESMVSVFRIKLREVLREDLSGTYGVRVNSSINRDPQENYRIDINFGCNPDRVEELSRMVLQQVDSLRSYGTTDVYINKVKESQTRKRETDLKENGFWLNQLVYLYSNELDPTLVLRIPDFIDGLSTAAVQVTAQKYFNPQNYIRMVLLPEP